MLSFDAASHTYAWDGKPVPNVTRIIERLTNYDAIPADVLERARDEGLAVHRMVELACRHDLDVARLPEWMIGCLNAWEGFVAETGFVLHASELRQYHEVYGYAGTLDLTGEMPRAKRYPGEVLIDLKRSFYAGAAIDLQTAAYAEQWDRRNSQRKIRHRFGLQLRKDGKYRLEPFGSPGDISVFLSYLNCYRWEQKNGYRH